MKKTLLFFIFLNTFLCCDNSISVKSSSLNCITSGNKKICSSSLDGLLIINSINVEYCTDIYVDNRLIGKLVMKIDKITFIPDCIFQYYTTSYNISTYQNEIAFIYGDSCGSKTFPPNCIFYNEEIKNEYSIYNLCNKNCVQFNDNTKKSNNCYGKVGQIDNEWNKYIGDKGCGEGNNPIRFPFAYTDSIESRYWFYAPFWSWSIIPSQNVFSVYKCSNSGKYQMFLSIKYIDLDASTQENNLNINEIFQGKILSFSSYNDTIKNQDFFNIKINNVIFTIPPINFNPNEGFLLFHPSNPIKKNYFVNNVEQINIFSNTLILGDLQSQTYEDLFKLNGDFIPNQYENENAFKNFNNVRLNKKVMNKKLNPFFPAKSDKYYIFEPLESALLTFLNNPDAYGREIFNGINNLFFKNGYGISLDNYGRKIGALYSTNQLLLTLISFSMPKNFDFTIETNEVCPVLIECNSPTGYKNSLNLGSYILIKLLSNCGNGSVRIDIEETEYVENEHILNNPILFLDNTAKQFNISFFISKPLNETVEIKLRIMSNTHIIFCNKTYIPKEPPTPEYNIPDRNFTENITNEQINDFSICSLFGCSNFLNDIWKWIKNVFKVDDFISNLIIIAIMILILGLLFLIIYCIIVSPKPQILNKTF